MTSLNFRFRGMFPNIRINLKSKFSSETNAAENAKRVIEECLPGWKWCSYATCMEIGDAL